MQAAEIQQAKVKTNFDPEKNKARRMGFVRMEVHNRDCANLQLPEGNIVTPGIGVVDVYEDSVPAVMALVEPEGGSRIGEVERTYWLRIAAATKNMLDSVETAGKYQHHGREEVLDLIRSKADSVVNDEFAKVMKTTALSIPGIYHELFGHGIAPLVSAKVIERGLPEPQRIGQEDENAKLLKLVAAAVGGGANAELVKQLQELRDELKSLRAQVQGKR